MRLATLLIAHFAGFMLAICALATLPHDTATGAILAAWGVGLMALTALGPNP